MVGRMQPWPPRGKRALPASSNRAHNLRYPDAADRPFRSPTWAGPRFTFKLLRLRSRSCHTTYWRRTGQSEGVFPGRDDERLLVPIAIARRSLPFSLCGCSTTPIVV